MADLSFVGDTCYGDNGLVCVYVWSRDSVILDGDFSPAELRAILAHMGNSTEGARVMDEKLARIIAVGIFELEGPDDDGYFFLTDTETDHSICFQVNGLAALKCVFTSLAVDRLLKE